MVNDSDMHLLAMLIEEEIKQEFSSAFLTGNLKRTIRIEKNSDGGYNIIIPAQRYDISEWKRTGVIRYVPGSYADAVDKSGGFSGTHKNYAERCVKKAIDKWLALKKEKYDLVRKE